MWCVSAPRHSLPSTLTTTHAVRSIASGAGPRSEGRCAPCAGPHGHTTWLGGWAAWFDGGFRGAEQARSRTPFPSPTGGDPAPRRAATLWCAGVACACGTMRASACATAKVVVARQHAVSVPNRSTVHGCGQGEAPDHTLGPLHATACSRRARFATPSRGVLAFVVKQRMRVAARAGAGWEGRCACRGVAGDVPGLWRGRRHARITQRRRVGELEPELYFLGVSGQFHELVKRRKNRLRASRAPSRGAPGRAHPVGNARRAHRCLAGLARRAGRGRAQCT